MAPARGRKKSTQQGRRSQKERRPQHGRRQRSRGRRSPVQERERRSQAKQKQEKKRASKRSSSAKTLNHTKRDGWFLSHEAQVFMTSFVENIYKQVSNEAEQLRRESRESLVNPEHVQAALQRVVPKRRWRRMPTVRSRRRR